MYQDPRFVKNYKAFFDGSQSERATPKSTVPKDVSPPVQKQNFTEKAKELMGNSPKPQGKGKKKRTQLE